MLLSSIGKNCMRLLSGQLKWAGFKAPSSMMRLYSFSKISTPMDFQKMKFDGIRLGASKAMLNELQTVPSQLERQRGYNTFVNNINGYDLPLQHLTSQKWLDVAQKFPYLFVKGQLKTMTILGKQLAEKMKRELVTKDEALELMEYIDDQVMKCYSPLQTLSEQMKQICEIVISKNQNYLRFIFRTTFCKNEAKKDAFLESATYSQQKEIYLRKFMESYKSQISKLQNSLNKAALKLNEETCEEVKMEKKDLMLEMVENLGQCSYFYNEVVRQLYKQNKQSKWFMEIGEDVKNTMINALDLYKKTSDESILTPTYILLKESKAKMDADLKFLELSAKGINNEEIIALKEELAEQYEAIGNEALNSVSGLDQKGVSEFKWYEIGLTLLKMNLKACKLKELKLVEIHGSLFFQIEDFLMAIENEAMRKPLEKRFAEFINAELEKLIQERLSH